MAVRPFILAAVSTVALFGASGEVPPLDELLRRMAETDAARSAQLQRYACTRKYVLINERFRKRAEVLAKTTWQPPGDKQFEIVSESGPGMLRSRVLHKMMDAEKKATSALRGRTPITAENYEFRLLGSGIHEGRPAWLLELKPRRDDPVLVRGRAWVDAEDYAVVRVEGVFAKNPSFWTREVRTSLSYGKFGDFWLPVHSQSVTEARLFGTSEVTIDYFDYQVEGSAERAAVR